MCVEVRRQLIGSWTSFSIPWAQGIGLRSSDLAASSFAHGTTLQVLVLSDFPCFPGNSVVSS